MSPLPAMEKRKLVQLCWKICSSEECRQIPEPIGEMAFWRRQPEEPKWPAAPAEGVDAFKKFYDAGTLLEVQSCPLFLDFVDM